MALGSVLDIKKPLKSINTERVESIKKGGPSRNHLFVQYVRQKSIRNPSEFPVLATQVFIGFLFGKF